MDTSASLSEQLSALTDALDDPGTDLTAILDVLLDDLTVAIPSFLGLIMTIQLDGQPVSLTAIDPDSAATARSSLQLPLDPLAGAGPDSTVVFYAAIPGAFVDLAADTRHAYQLDGEVVLDQHIPTHDGKGTPGPPTVADPTQAGVANRAVGFLIAQGHVPEQARAELHRRATRQGIDIYDAATGILGFPTDPRPPSGT